MRKSWLLLTFVVVIVFFMQSVSASGQSDNFHLYTPTEVYEGTTNTLLIKALDQNGAPLDGRANDISCYLEDPSGTMILNGNHPAEQTSGIYIISFTAGQTTGICRCWATFVYNGTLTEMDAGLFTLNWDPYENISRLYERIGNIIYLEHWDNANISQQLVYDLQIQNNGITNISQQMAVTDSGTNLRQIALEQGIGVIFWTVALSAFGMISAVYYSHRKGKHERQQLLAATTSVPQALVGEVVQWGRKRGK
jgi:phage terminase large subunit-like protein